MAEYQVFFTDHDVTADIRIEGETSSAALAAAVADLQSSNEWIASEHRAWIEDENGDIIAEAEFTTAPAPAVSDDEG